MRNNPLQPLLDLIPAPFRNRYVLVLTLFAAWMIFFDKHDVLTQWRLQKTVNKLEQEKDYYSDKIKEAEQERLNLELDKDRPGKILYEKTGGRCLYHRG